MMHHQKHKRNGAMTRKMKKMVKTSMISTLPEDVIVEVIAQLASRSPLPFADLYSLKKTCKMFFALSKDDMVKQRIALEREFSSLNWTATDRRTTILNACANAGNPEACFILALINIFEQGDISTGAELLKRAICKGHKAALYLMNILHLRLQEHPLSADMFSLDFFKADERKFCDDDQFESCREKVLNVIRQVTWNRWHASFTGKERRCKSLDCGISKGWDGHRSFCSDTCRWNHEHIAFCREM